MRKIAIIAEKVGYFGGLEKQILDIVKALLEDGEEVKVFVRKDCVSEIPYEKFYTPDKPKSLQPILYFLLTKKLAYSLKRDGYSVVSFMRPVFGADVFVSDTGSHFEELKAMMRFYPFYEARYIFSVHSTLFFLLTKLFLRSGTCKFVIANSDTAKEQIIKYMKPKSEIVVIRNWVDTRFLNPSLRAKIMDEERKKFEGKKLILFSSGSKLRREGFLFLCSALREIDSGGFIFFVAGKQLNRYYKSFLPRNSIVLGPQKDFWRTLSFCDIFIRPSIYNTFSTSCAEALALGVPIMVSSSSGISEIIKDGENGFIVDKPYDKKKFAEKILYALSLDLDRIGSAGRKTAEEFLSLEKAKESFKYIVSQV